MSKAEIARSRVLEVLRETQGSRLSEAAIAKKSNTYGYYLSHALVGLLRQGVVGCEKSEQGFFWFAK